jgi:hypothetical protein
MVDLWLGMNPAVFFHVSPLLRLGAVYLTWRQAIAAAAAESGKILPPRSDGRLIRRPYAIIESKV